MATIAVASDSPGSPNFSGEGGAKSPTKLRRSSLHSPWVQVVRGGAIGGDGEGGADPPNVQSVEANETALPSSPSPPAPERDSFSVLSAPMETPPAPASPEYPKAVDCSQNSNSANVVSGVDKPVWNKAVNKVCQVSAAVMDDFSWPALGQYPQKSSANSLKHPSDGESFVAEASEVSAVSILHEKRNVNPDSSASNVPPIQQRSVKRGSGGNRYNGHALGPSPVQLSSKLSVHEITQKNVSHQEPNVFESSSRETGLVGGSSGHSHVMSDHSIKRSSFRRGNIVQNAHGDGSYHNNYSGRRDHDRGPNGRNNFPGFNSRDARGQLPRRGQGRGYIRSPAHGIRSFMAPPPPMRPYVNTMFYPNDAPVMYYVPTIPAEHFGGMPFPPPPPPPPPLPPAYMHRAVLGPDNTLPSMIVKQIDYYFSEANLVKDEFLRSKMDGEGWVPVSLIASFRRVQQLTDSIPMILDSLRTSNVVEVQGTKIRKSENWRKWIPDNLFPTSSVAAEFRDDKVAAAEGISTEKTSNSDASLHIHADDLSDQLHATQIADIDESAC